jgi:hypothetical protein
VLAIGEKEKLYMKKKTKINYTGEPLDMETVPDFLPPPEDLVLKEETVKVTLSLSKSSIDFFKKHADRHDTKYQTMIRQLLNIYTAKNS